jgi:hypothetical protein
VKIAQIAHIASSERWGQNDDVGVHASKGVVVPTGLLEIWA